MNARLRGADRLAREITLYLEAVDIARTDPLELALGQPARIGWYSGA